MATSLINYAFSFDELQISVAQVGEAMGYGSGPAPDPFPDLIAEALIQSSDLTTIKGSLLVTDNFFPDLSGIIVFDGITFSVGRKIARQLNHAEGAALFICTAGAGIGEKSKELMAAGFLVEGYIMDVIGSLTVEAAVDKIQNSFETELHQSGKRIANRYSPGYCGWALKEQKQFFELFPHDRCGISLTDSFLMDPIKSVSGIIGYGTEIRKTAYECQMCELDTCFYRAIRLARLK